MSDPDIIFAALHEKMGAEIINQTSSEKQARFMLRIKKGPNTTIWLSVIEHLLVLADTQLATGQPHWTIDVSKQYFRKDGELKFGWRVILQGAQLQEHFKSIANEIHAAKLTGPVMEVQEVQLHGSATRRSGGYTGTVAVGPAATR